MSYHNCFLSTAPCACLQKEKVTNWSLHQGKSITIHRALVLLFLSSKLHTVIASAHRTKANCWRLSNSAGEVATVIHFALSIWHSWVYIVVNKSNLFWAWIKPALLSRTPDSTTNVSAVAWDEGCSHGVSGNTEGSKVLATAVPRSSAQGTSFSTSSLTRLIPNCMSFLHFWTK